MPRSSREFHSGLAYHLYNRGAERARVFHRPEEYSLFLDSVGSTRPPCVAVIALCLLPNHWHMAIFVRDDPELVSPWLQRSMTRFAVSHRARWGGAGPLWQGRTCSKPIAREVSLSRVVRYIEENSVAAQRAARPEEWPWSSASPALREKFPWIADRSGLGF